MSQLLRWRVVRKGMKVWGELISAGGGYQPSAGTPASAMPEPSPRSNDFRGSVSGRRSLSWEASLSGGVPTPPPMCPEPGPGPTMGGGGAFLAAGVAPFRLAGLYRWAFRARPSCNPKKTTFMPYGKVDAYISRGVGDPCNDPSRLGGAKGFSPSWVRENLLRREGFPKIKIEDVASPCHKKRHIHRKWRAGVESNLPLCLLCSNPVMNECLACP